MNTVHELSTWEENEYLLTIIGVILVVFIIFAMAYWLDSTHKEKKGLRGREKTLIWILHNFPKIKLTDHKEVEYALLKIDLQDLNDEGREALTKFLMIYYRRIFKSFLTELLNDPEKVEELFKFNFTFLREGEVIYSPEMKKIWEDYMKATSSSYTALSEKFENLKSFLSTYGSASTYFCELVHERCHSDFRDVMNQDEIKLGISKLTVPATELYLVKIKEIVHRPLLTYDFREKLRTVVSPSVDLLLNHLSITGGSDIYFKAVATKNDILFKDVEGVFLGPSNVS